MKIYKSSPEKLANQWVQIDRIPFSKRLNPILRKSLELSLTKVEDLILITNKLKDLNASYERSYYDRYVCEELLRLLSSCKEQDFCFFLQARGLLRSSDLYLYYIASKHDTLFSIKKLNYQKENVEQRLSQFNENYLHTLNIFLESNSFVNMIRDFVQKSELFKDLPPFLSTTIIFAITKKNCISFIVNTIFYMIAYQAMKTDNAFVNYQFFKAKTKFIASYIRFCEWNLGISLRSVLFIYRVCSNKDADDVEN
jgi:hypothetical protein